MHKGFPEDLLGCIVVAMIDAFCWIADRRIIHRDVKPQNILLNYNGQIKLCDFGASKLVSESWSAISNAGTLRYTPPEKFDRSKVGIPYNEKWDIWSLGITLIECIALKLPFLQGTNLNLEL